jgi:hypothetical protein
MNQTSTILFFVLALAVSACSGSGKQSERTSSTSSVSFSSSATTTSVTAAANAFIKKQKLDWGEPVDVKWQGKPLNRWLVVYPTPDSEIGWAGIRGVHIEPNGDAWLVPRG